MRERLEGARVLIYSHDTFGLGHLRRCRAIAHSLVERFKGLSVLILSGSPIIGSFDFRARVDFVRIPGVIKLHNGEYKSLGTAHRPRPDDGDARGDHPPHGRVVPPAPLPGRQGAARAQGRGGADARDAAAAGDAPGARPARHHGRADAAVPRVGAQAGDAGAGVDVRRDLGLRAGGDRRPAGRAGLPPGGAAQDDLHRLHPAHAAARRAAGRAALRRCPLPAGHGGWRRRRGVGDRLGALRLRARPDDPAPGAGRARAVHDGRAPARVPQARGPAGPREAC